MTLAVAERTDANDCGAVAPHLHVGELDGPRAGRDLDVAAHTDAEQELRARCAPHRLLGAELVVVRQLQRAISAAA